MIYDDNIDILDVFNLPITELYLLIDTRLINEYESSHIAGAFSLPFNSHNNNDDIEASLLSIVNSIDSSQMRKVCIICNDNNTNNDINIETNDTIFDYIKNNGLPNTYNKSRRHIPKTLILFNKFSKFTKMYPFLVSKGPTQYDDDSILVSISPPIFFPSQILSWGLYLGNKSHASDIRLIDILGIKTIINVTVEIPNYHLQRDDITYINCNVVDDVDTIMLPTWKLIADTIESCKSNGKKVLVHCSAGRSRSASSIIYYLMKKEFKIPLNEAFQYVIRCRDIVDPNFGFREQLKNID